MPTNNPSVAATTATIVPRITSSKINRYSISIHFFFLLFSCSFGGAIVSGSFGDEIVCGTFGVGIVSGSFGGEIVAGTFGGETSS
jgi:hypothetical protein